MKNRMVKRLLASAICVVLLGQGMVTFAANDKTDVNEGTEIIELEAEKTDEVKDSEGISIDRRILDSVQAASEIVDGQTEKTEMKAEEKVEDNNDDKKKTDDGALDVDNDEKMSEKKLVNSKTGITVEGLLPEGVELGAKAINGNLADYSDYDSNEANMVIHYNKKGYDVVQAYEIWFEFADSSVSHTDLPDTLRISIPNPAKGYDSVVMSRLGDNEVIEKNLSYEIKDGKAVINTNDVGNILFLKKDDSKKQQVENMLNNKDNGKKTTNTKSTEARKAAPQTGDVENIVLLGMAFAASAFVLAKRKRIKFFQA